MNVVAPDVTPSECDHEPIYPTCSKCCPCEECAEIRFYDRPYATTGPATKVYPILFGEHDAEAHITLTDEGIVLDVVIGGEIVASTWEFAQDFAERAR
jgi:hypothetical protein